MVGTPKEGYEMQIIKEYNKYVTFNNPTYGNVDAETGKVHIPLNNLKFIVNGNELQFDFEVYVSNDNEYYYYDVEKLFFVHRSAFDPAPNVDSAIVKIDFIPITVL